VLEVSRNKLQDLGIRYPDQLAVSAVGASGTPGNLSIEEWRNINSGNIRLSVTNPTFVLNLKKIDTDTNLLANPRIRVRNRENAKIHIGERVPVITTTSTANVGISDSVAYLDVGLKLDIVPNVYLDDEVAMKVSLEVSNILETIVTASGTQTYRLGTRNTATTLRLKNGETQVLAGLIQDDERKTANKVPGLSSLPIIGRLFSSNNDSKIKTEIVLLITPRVLRNIVQPEIDVTEFSSGTADSIGKAPINYSPADTRGAASPVNSNLNQVTPQGANPADANLAIPQQGLQPNLPRKALPVTPISPIPSVPQPMTAPVVLPAAAPDAAPVSTPSSNVPVINETLAVPPTPPAPTVVTSPSNVP
jgi:general secretion pathway protein D